MPPGEPLAPPGGGKCHVLADSGNQEPPGGEHEGLHRSGDRGLAGLPVRGEHDRGPGRVPAGRGRGGPGGGGDGGGEHLRRRGGPAGVPGPGRRAAGVLLQGGKHHGLHAGLRGAAL